MARNLFHDAGKSGKKKRMTSAAQRFVSAKIAKVNREGVRGHGAAPGQAAAIAYNEARKRGYRVPDKK